MLRHLQSSAIGQMHRRACAIDAQRPRINADGATFATFEGER